MPIVESVSDDGLRSDATDSRKVLPSRDDDYFSPSRVAGLPSTTPTLRSDSSPLLHLPAELIDAILSYLSLIDLAAVSESCQALRKHAVAESLWYRRVQANVPGITLTSPHPHQSYRELYRAHDPRWFLPKYKIWFCDRDLVGRLIVVRYDPRRGCIEGYQLLAVSRHPSYLDWAGNSDVKIHSFEPRVCLHLDKPVLQFGCFDNPEQPRGFSAEVPMKLDSNHDNPICSNFLLARALEPDVIAERLRDPFPYNGVWPPPSVPARHRVTGVPADRDSGELLPTDLPSRRSEASDQTFRIRQWFEMGGSPAVHSVMLGQGLAGMMQVLTGMELPSTLGANGPGGPIPGLHGIGSVHLGEEIVTYSTLDPVLYTPTELKPWRGIWVGDYSGYGCEFLLINQPDDPEATDEELGLARADGESDQQWEARRRDARVYRGRLEAIKLTGDPNVPRGEYTFVADDLGEEGFVGIAQDPPFKGARLVKSKGHIAANGFRGDKYIESRLLLLSHNRLAQYWVNFGHISMFERVNIDKFLVP